MLERHEIDTFLALAEELHFGHTAQRLRVSVTRVSQVIRKVERRVGAPLFNRTSRRVRLTAVGQQLYDDIQPPWTQVAAGLQRAIDSGRGVTGTLRTAFVGAAAGQFLAQAAEVFHSRRPDCEVLIREAQPGEAVSWVLDATVDLALTEYPAGTPDLACGPVLVSEARMLAVPSTHFLAQQETVSMEDLSRIPLIQLPATTPAVAQISRAPDVTPAGRPIEAGPVTRTFQEALTLVGSAQGAFPVGAHMRRYYARPDVTYVFFSDADPVEWALIWRKDNTNARVTEFNRAAHELVDR